MPPEDRAYSVTAAGMAAVAFAVYPELHRQTGGDPGRLSMAELAHWYASAVFADAERARRG